MIEATGVKWAELENWNAVLIRVAKMAAAEPWNERLRDQVADEVARAWAAVDVEAMSFACERGEGSGAEACGD